MNRSLSFVLLVLMYGAVANAHGPYRYDYSYNENIQKWLKFHNRPATFIDAFLRCHREGALLALPHTKEMQQVMENLAGIGSPILTGIHATISKHDFTSIEGDPVDKLTIKWAQDQEKNIDDQGECTIMLPDGFVTYASCNETYPFLCYRDDIKSEFNTECGTYDKEYKFEQRTGSCYKIHVVGQTWREAQSTCVSEGGHLAIINSGTEARILKDLFATKPESSIVSKFNYVVAVGFLDWNKKGSWFTVHGQTLEEAGFAGWSEGNPNNNQEIDGGQYCGGFFRWGQLDDIWCETVSFAFICEKSPDSLLSSKN